MSNVKILTTKPATFEQPFEMLKACHERVKDKLNLLSKIIIHIQKNGIDNDAKIAAENVKRYFDIAAPHHHLDEELHVLPLTINQNQEISQYTQQLEKEHKILDSQWLQVKEFLNQIINQENNNPNYKINQNIIELITQFNKIYQNHIIIEETIIYPAAEKQITPQDLKKMTQEMNQRRQT